MPKCQNGKQLMATHFLCMLLSGYHFYHLIIATDKQRTGKCGHDSPPELHAPMKISNLCTGFILPTCPVIPFN